jgi:two-component system, OmpR family, alkaline phosphatase synthesis response regulator PhoP
MGFIMSERAHLSQSKILIAENDPRRAQSLRAILEAAGLQVFEASDSSGAWKVIQTQELAIALVDEDLPGLAENNILLRLRADPGLARLPIIVLGDAMSSVQGAQWLDMGADDYIGRSISVELLKAEVRAKLRRRKPLP